MSDFHEELMALIQTSSKQCNLADDSKDNNLSTKKKIALTTLLALIANDTTTIKLFNNEEIDSYIQMVKSNIYRPIRYVNPKVLFYDELPDLSDPQWPHLELAYLILERIIHCLPNLSCFNYEFIRTLYPMLGSPDENERKEIIHIFKEFILNHLECSNEISKDLSHIFLMHVETQEKPFEVWTSLQIFLVICRLSYDHEKYYKMIEQSVFPLIKDTFSFYFNTYLTDILSFYADGSSQNAKKVIEQILRYWPKTSIPKMNLYTKFLSDTLSKLSQDDLKVMIQPIFKLFSKECTSDSTELAENSLSIITKPELEDLINNNSEEIHKIMIPSIMSAVTDHWWSGVRDKGTVSIANVINNKSMDYVKDIAVNSVNIDQNGDQKLYNDWIKVMNSASANYSDIKSNLEKSKIDKEFTHFHDSEAEKKDDSDEYDEKMDDNNRFDNYEKDNDYFESKYSKINDDPVDDDYSYGNYSKYSSSINYDDYYHTNNYQDY